MTKRDFIIQYVLNCAQRNTEGLRGAEHTVNEAVHAWEQIAKKAPQYGLPVPLAATE